MNRAPRFVSGSASWLGAGRIVWVAMVWLSMGVVCGSAQAEDLHLVSINYGATSWDSSSVGELLRDQLERRLIPLRTEDQTQVLLAEQVAFGVDETVDRYIRSSLDALSVGRESYFGGDYARAVELILPRLEALETAPEVLAFRLDFVPVLLDSFLVLAQAYELLGRPDDSIGVMERVATIFTHTDVDEALVPPTVAESFRAARDRLARRAVRVHWTSDEPCEPYVNGSRVAIVSGGELLIPNGTTAYLQFRCAGFAGVVERILPSETSVRWSQSFDDALRRSSDVFELLPRSSSDAEVLPALLRAASSMLSASVVSIAKVPVGIGIPDAIELGYVSAGGRFRAIRVSDETVADPEQFSLAVDYLLGVATMPPEPSILWKNDPAWVAVGDWNASTGEPTMVERPVRAGGAALGWSTIALGLASGGAATYFFIDQRNTEENIAECTLETCLGDDEVVSMRSRVERDRRMGITLAAVSGAAIVTGTLALAVRGTRLRSGRHIVLESAGLDIIPRGASAHVGVSF